MTSIHNATFVNAASGDHHSTVPIEETSFRVFIVVAGGRPIRDRFFVEQREEGTYSKEGLQWVQHTSMRDILVRHYPGLARPLENGKNKCLCAVGEAARLISDECVMAGRGCKYVS